MFGLIDRDEDEAEIWKGVVAGVAGGLVASLVMERFQGVWSKAAVKLQLRAKSRAKPATVKAADAVSEKVLGRKVPKNKQRMAGEAVHYAMGISSAAAYGALAEVAPAVTASEGVAFGLGVWLLADEVSVPALGLSKSPRKIPAEIHIYAMASHLVYGVVTEIVRRAVRSLL